MRHAPSDLTEFAAAALQSVGVSAADAETTAGLLVAADVRGRTGHGLIRLSPYVARIRAGGMIADAVPQVLHETAVSAQIDGGNGLGQVVMSRAADLAIRKA
jgi:LDH2 family malate/lactate/ureidoglycolate dehydrogenase